MSKAIKFVLFFVLMAASVQSLATDDQRALFIVVNKSRGTKVYRDRLAAAIPSFISGWPNNTHIYVLRTDAEPDIAINDALSEKKYILPSDENAIKLLQSAIQTPPTHVNRDFTMYAILRKFKDIEQKYDQIDVVLLSNLDDERTSNAEFLVKNFADNFALSPIEQFRFHSVVIRPGDQKCLSWDTSPNLGQYNTLQGGPGQYGNTYVRLSELTGGHIFSICEEDYAAKLSELTTVPPPDFKFIEVPL